MTPDLRGNKSNQNLCRSDLEILEHLKTMSNDAFNFCMKNTQADHFIITLELFIGQASQLTQIATKSFYSDKTKDLVLTYKNLV